MWYVIVCVFGGSGQLVYSILWFDDRGVLCKWIDTSLNGFRCNLTIELGFGLSGSILVVSAGFKTIRLICIGSVGSIYLLMIWADCIRFQRLGRLAWVRIYLGIFGELDWSIWFGDLNWICFIFYGFELFGWIWADFSRFAWICVDLGWLERIAVDLEDRYELMFVGFGRAQWIRVEMATYLDGSGKNGWLWENLIGFGLILGNFPGSGCRSVRISKLDSVGYKGI